MSDVDGTTLPRTLEEAITEIDSLKSQLSGSDLKVFAQNRELRTENVKLKEEIRRLTEQCVSQTFAVRGLEKSEEKLKGELAALESAKATLEQEKKTLEDKKADLEQQVLDLGGQLEDFKSKEIHLSQELEKVTAHHSETTQELERLQQEYEQDTQTRASELEQTQKAWKDEVAAKEDAIKALEQRVEQFKEEFLSQEFAPVSSLSEANMPAAGEAFEVLTMKMEDFLGFPGRALVEQVFRLSGVEQSSSNPAELEETFEALQDTASQLVRSDEQEQELAALLKDAWQEIGLGDGATPKAAAKPAEPAVEVEPAPAAEAPAEPEPPTPPEPAPVEPAAQAEPPASPEPASVPEVAEAPAQPEPPVTETEESVEAVEEAPESAQTEAQPEPIAEPASEEATGSQQAQPEDEAPSSEEVAPQASEEPEPLELEIPTPTTEPEPEVAEQTVQEEPVAEGEPVEESVAEEAPEVVEAPQSAADAEPEDLPELPDLDAVLESDIPDLPEAPQEQLEPTPVEPTAEEPVAESAEAAPPVEETSQEATPEPIEEPAEAVEEAEPEPVEESAAAPEASAEPEAAPEPAESGAGDFEEAARLLEEGRHGQALPLFERLSEAEPTEATYLVGRIACLAGEGRYAEAYQIGQELAGKDLGESAEVFNESMDAALAGLAAEAESDLVRKEFLLELLLRTSNPEQLHASLDEADEIAMRIAREGELSLLQARHRVGQDDVTEYLIDALHSLSDRTEVFSLLKNNLERYPELRPLSEFLERLLDSSRAESLEAESGVKELLGMGEGVEELLDEVDPGEEAVVQVFLEHLIPRSEVEFDIPSEDFEEFMLEAEPAAFVGSLRQALRSVDYTLFFDEIEVLSYDGEEHFLLRSSPEPTPTLLFGAELDDVPPEELRFLVLRELFSMYRRHSQLAHISAGLDDQRRVRLVRACIDIFSEFESKVPAETMAQLDQLTERAAEGGQDNDFRADLESFLRQVYLQTESDSFLELGDFLYEGQLNRKWLDSIADGFAARQTGIVVASYAICRDLLEEEEFEQVEENGFGWLYQEENLGKHSELRLRLQRLWSSPLKALISEPEE